MSDMHDAVKNNEKSCSKLSIHASSHTVTSLGGVDKGGLLSNATTESGVFSLTLGSSL